MSAGKKRSMPQGLPLAKQDPAGSGKQPQNSANDLVFDERASKLNSLKGLKVEAKKRIGSATLDFLNPALPS